MCKIKYIFLLIFFIFFNSNVYGKVMQDGELTKTTADYYLNIIYNNNYDISKTKNIYRKITTKGFKIDSLKKYDELKDKYVFYDLNGIPSAYLYTTVDGDQSIGYIAISPTTEIYPLLSSSSNTHPMNNFSACLEIAKKQDSSITINTKYKPVYLGLFYYFFVFKPNSKSPVVVEAVSKQLVNYDILKEMQGKYETAKKVSASSASKRWEEINNAGSKYNIESTQGSNSISGLPAYNWYRGCTTTTSTMILSYYGINKGYGGFNESPDSFNWTQPDGWIFDSLLWGCQDNESSIYIPRDLADELADEMDISKNCGLLGDFGATSSEQKSAMSKVATNHGYNFNVSVRGKSDILTYLSEIDSGRPTPIIYNVAAHMGSSGWHSAAGYGYSEVSSSEHILYFNNTWDLTTNAVGSRNSFTYETALNAGYMRNFITFVPSESIKPNVTAFSINKDEIKPGESITISYTVKDSGGSALTRVELWRTSDLLGVPNSLGWSKLKTNRHSGNGPLSGSFSHSPSSGKYWYGVHVVDGADNWNDEQNSQTSGTPGDYGPLKVVVDSGVPIELSSFKATLKKGHTLIEWTTQTETDNLGFNIYRGSRKKGKYRKINDEIIPGNGTTSVSHSYSYIDNTGKKGKKYYYYLEDIANDGKAAYRSDRVKARLKKKK